MALNGSGTMLFTDKKANKGLPVTLARQRVDGLDGNVEDPRHP